MPDDEVGLRERKKLKTRAAIQREGLRLFLEKGFQETTIEEIAEAVEISPSTFFNYFPSKEDVALADDLDPLLIEAFNAQPANLNAIGALRRAMRSVFGNLSPEQDLLMRRRMRLIASDEDLRAAMLKQFAGLVDEIAAVIATRVRRKPADFALRNLAGALLGVMMAAMLAVAADPKADLMKVVDRALAHLEAGLPLD